MNDGIIKGTGNSRYLKGCGWPSTYAEFKAMAEAGTLPFDFNGINAAGWQVLGTLLSKANLLSDATAAKLDNVTTVDGALGFLGKFNEYWWKRRTSTQAYVEKYTEVSSNDPFSSYRITSYKGRDTVIQYSDEITMGSDGALTLNSPQSLTVRANSSSATAANANLKGKYIIIGTNSNIMKVSSDAVFTYFTWGDDNYELDVAPLSELKWVSSELQDVVGEWEYIQSLDSTTYPHSGVSDGYGYSYLGKPLDNALGVNMKFAYGYDSSGTMIASIDLTPYGFSSPPIAVVSPVYNSDYQSVWVKSCTATTLIYKFSQSPVTCGVNWIAVGV